jgi:glycosyltransferase involved in cell wall biosynthesis
MNVCFINTNREWGGGEKWHARTASELAERGHEVTVVSYPNTSLSEKVATVATVVEMPVSNLTFLNPFDYLRILRFFKKDQFDVVILNLPRDVKAFAKAAKTSGVKKVIYRRGMNHPIRNTLINRRLYLKFVDGIIANSQEVGRSVSSQIPELAAKVTVIPNGIDVSQIRPKRKPNRDLPVIGNLGRLVAQKGQTDLIKLGALLKAREIPFRIYIGGDGPLYDSLRSEINSANLNDEIFLMGEVKAEDFFKRIDIFVFTSRFEGLSNALLEALQFRKPVVCYAIPSNLEVITHGENGFTVPPGQPDRMIEYLLQLLDDDDCYERMQDMGKKVLEEKFDQNKLTEMLLRYLGSDAKTPT